MTDQRRSSLRPRAALLALLALAVAAPALAAAPPASAETAGDVSWAMRPASDGAPDKRSWIELELDPGAEVQEEAAVSNLSTQTVTFRITAADGYFTDTGRFSMLPSSEPSVEAGTWIDAPESVTVDPGATAVVPFTVTVPEDAEPGDHAAGIAASITSVGTEEGGASVGVESRVGFRVMTRVSGEVSPGLTVENVRSDYRLDWNPLHPGSVAVDAEIVNTGNVRLLLDGTVSAGGASAPLVPEEATQQELLPGDRRTVSVVLDGVWPLFAVGVDFTVAPTVVTPSEELVEIAPVSQSATVTAIPVPQLLSLLGVLLILGALFAGRLRSRRRVEELVREAKEEGLREGALGTKA
ncbi:WxL protein peptidoglycan domain-containing protein [Rathayibacter sp. SD072]|uniref:WxL protein peptidoglycan domain-containing protein n=1 Tax=Rathayibacter sp. SD072 TaxID=2781731 RepID=UPI001A95D31B|nr:DUF916 domain-containing protein [Rathayibacter sp. SD072]MBO0984367.1 DUF916 domain-containing protein [Rathayibacter sp. SD072]